MSSSQHPIAVYRRAEFRGKRYRIRPAQEQDQDLMFGWRSHAETSRYLSGAAPGAIEDQLAWFEKVRLDTSCSYHIVEDNGVPIGFTSMVNLDAEHSDAEWGMVMGNVREPGVMKVVAPLCCLCAFQLVGLESIYTCINENNSGAIRRVEQMAAKLFEDPSAYQKSGELLFRIDSQDFLKKLPALVDRTLSGMDELAVEMHMTD